MIAESAVYTVTKHLFTLKPLASFSGVDEVTYAGMPTWFGQCLSMHIRGEGGDLKKLHWPTLKTKKRRKDEYSRAKTVEVSTRSGWNVKLDWLGFAERNGVVVPGGYEQGRPPRRMTSKEEGSKEEDLNDGT